MPRSAVVGELAHHGDGERDQRVVPLPAVEASQQPPHPLCHGLSVAVAATGVIIQSV